jgi:hypothetical protein
MKKIFYEYFFKKIIVSFKPNFLRLCDTGASIHPLRVDQ